MRARQSTSLVNDQVREPRLFRHLEQVMQTRLTQIRIHQDHAAAVLGQANRQVGGGEGLAFGRASAGDEQAAHCLARVRKLDVGAQRAEGLRDGGARGGEGHDLLGVGASAVPTADGPDDAQGGHAVEGVQLLGGLDGVVQVLQQEGQAHPQPQGGGQGEEDVLGGLEGQRLGRQGRCIYHHGGVHAR